MRSFFSTALRCWWRQETDDGFRDFKGETCACKWVTSDDRRWLFHHFTPLPLLLPCQRDFPSCVDDVSATTVDASALCCVWRRRKERRWKKGNERIKRAVEKHPTNSSSSLSSPHSPAPARPIAFLPNHASLSSAMSDEEPTKKKRKTQLWLRSRHEYHINGGTKWSQKAIMNFFVSELCVELLDNFGLLSQRDKRQVVQQFFRTFESLSRSLSNIVSLSDQMLCSAHHLLLHKLCSLSSSRNLIAIRRAFASCVKKKRKSEEKKKRKIKITFRVFKKAEKQRNYSINKGIKVKHKKLD